MIEQWKDLPNYEGYYTVSNTGKIKSLDRVVNFKDGRCFKYKGKEIKQHLTKDGYLFCGVSKNSIRETFLIHRAVGLCFVENEMNKPVINHIDGNRSNNHSSNLEWCTQSENVLYSYHVLGYKASEETRRKLSESQKLKIFTEAHRRNLSISQTGEKSHKAIPVIDINTNERYVSLKDYALKNNLNYDTTKGHWRQNKLKHIKKLK